MLTRAQRETADDIIRRHDDCPIFDSAPRGWSCDSDGPAETRSFVFRLSDGTDERILIAPSGEVI